MNVSDSDIVRAVLIDHGHSHTSDIHNAGKPLSSYSSGSESISMDLAVRHQYNSSTAGGRALLHCSQITSDESEGDDDDDDEDV